MKLLLPSGARSSDLVPLLSRVVLSPVVLALSLGLLPALGFGAEAAEPRRILLITLDGARADLALQGEELPALARLAREGIWLTGATTPSPQTFPATVSLLTARVPWRSGVVDEFAAPLADGVPTLAEVFSNAGWATEGFPSDYLCHARSGIARGFSAFHLDSPSLTDSARTERALASLREPRTQPLLLWIGFSLLNSHEPWERFLGCDATSRVQYVEAARAVDAEITRLGEALGHPAAGSLFVLCGTHGENVPSWPLTGARASDSPLPGHGLDLSESTLRVPLILLGGAIPAGGSDSLAAPRAWVSTLDLLPTLAEWAGIPAPAGIDGTSLLPLLRGGPFKPRALVHAVFQKRTLGWAPRYAARQGDWKILRYGERWGMEAVRSTASAAARDQDFTALARTLGGAFDVRVPPSTASVRVDSLFDREIGEMRDLYRSRDLARTEGGTQARQHLEQLAARARANGPITVELALSAVFRRNEKSAAFLLDSLRIRLPGFIEGEAAYVEHLLAFHRNEVAVQRLTSLSGWPMFESDRLWRLAAVNLAAGEEFDAERVFLQARQVGSPPTPRLLRFGELAPTMRQLRAEYGNSPDRTEPRIRLGRLLGELELYDDAYREIHQARGLNPDDAEADYWLAYLLLQEGRGKHAAGALERALKKEPLNLTYQVALGHAYILMHEEEKALEQLDGAIALGSKDPTAHYNAACLMVRQGRNSEALDLLESAVRLGYANRVALLLDPDLGPLRSDPRFEQLLNSVR